MHSSSLPSHPKMQILQRSRNNLWHIHSHVGGERRLPYRLLCFSHKQLVLATVNKRMVLHGAVPILLRQYSVFVSFIAHCIKAGLLTSAEKGQHSISHFVFCTDPYQWGIRPFLETSPFLALFLSSAKITDKMDLDSFCQQGATVRAVWEIKQWIFQQ